MARGKRESQWLALRRCLAIIRRTQQGPTDWQGLVEAVLAEVDPEAYGPQPEQSAPDLLHDDLARIRNALQIDIRADRRTREYFLRDSDTPLLDLPDEDLATLAWLEQTFNPNSPKYREVQAFLKRLQSYLAPARRQLIEQHRTALVLDLGQRDEDRILPEVEAGLNQALARRRRVELEYKSPQQADDHPRRHVVDIYEPAYFDTERGHYYLYGWCHYAVGPTGRDTVEDYLLYRLGRIGQVKILPDKLPMTPPTPRRYEVVYRLAKDIARYGVTYRRWINIDRIEEQEAGPVIYGTTTNLFSAVQELMHYRHKCQVLGGPEMVTRMKETVRKMADLYEIG